MKNFKVGRMPPARQRGQQRCGSHVAEESGRLAAAIICDSTDSAGDHHHHKLVLVQLEARGPTRCDERESAAVAATEPVQAKGPAVWGVESLGQQPGGDLWPFLVGLFGREKATGDRRRQE
jgi:hypothetical protein